LLWPRQLSGPTACYGWLVGLVLAWPVDPMDLCPAVHDVLPIYLNPLTHHIAHRRDPLVVYKIVNSEAKDRISQRNVEYPGLVLLDGLAVISELGSNTSSFLDNERKKKLLTEFDMALAGN